MFRGNEFKILFGVVFVVMAIAASIGIGDANLKKLISVFLEGWS